MVTEELIRKYFGLDFGEELDPLFLPSKEIPKFIRFPSGLELTVHRTTIDNITFKTGRSVPYRIIEGKVCVLYNPDFYQREDKP